MAGKTARRRATGAGQSCTAFFGSVLGYFRMTMVHDTMNYNSVSHVSILLGSI